MERVWIGTSGWVYKHWAVNFYPSDLPQKDELPFYAVQFPTVEINATFYRLPTTAMVKGWREKAPDHFLFAVKGSRFITHLKRLKGVDIALKKYLHQITPLKEHLGPILWQLPPNFEKTPENDERLEHFLQTLPKKLQHAVEFRHPSWIEAATHALLRQHEVANVWISSQRMPIDFTITAKFVYLRFHGLTNGPAHDYTKKQLQPWAEQLIQAAHQDKPCYVYFNNDLNTRAPQNAKMLMDMLGELTMKPIQNDLETPRCSYFSSVRNPRSKRLHRLPRSY